MNPPRADDDASWQVYEDWLLETDDPRARLVRLEKAGEGTEAARVELARVLFGSEQIGRMVEGRDWRAGFARGAKVAPSAWGAQPWEAPALTVLRELEIVAAGRAASIVTAAGCAPFAPSLESLAIDDVGSEPGSLDASVLHRFVRLERLHVGGATLRLVYAPSLASLRSLELALAPAAVGVLLRAGCFPELRALTIRTGTLLYPWHGVFEHVLAGTCAPRLEALHLEAAPTSASIDFLCDLAQSPLAERLQRLSFAGTECATSSLLRLARSLAG